MMPIFLIAMLAGCLEPREDDGAPNPFPSESPGPSRWEEIQLMTETYCVRCHEAAGFLDTETDFLVPRVRRRLERRDMPPPSSPESRAMDQATREKLVRFFDTP
jgi:hypothetical protein